jgi:hypothetical protein
MILEVIVAIGTLSTVAVTRNTEAPKKADTGRTSENATDATEDASLSDLLGTTVPTAVVAAYTAFTAAVVGGIDEPTAAVPNPDQLLNWRWAALIVMVVFAPVYFYFDYRNKAAKVVAQAEKLRQPIPPTKWPIVELLAVTVASLGWGLALPESPAQAQLEGTNRWVLPIFVAFIAVLINGILANMMKAPRK